MAERSCILTRRTSEQADLVRLVLSPEGELFVDYRGKLPGRGAWVSPEREVLEALEKKPKLISRAFRTSVNPNGLLEKLQAANERAVMDGLSLASRAGALVGGGKRVRETLQSSGCIGLVFSGDASERLKADLQGRKSEIPVFNLGLSSIELGGQIGKGSRSALAVIASKPGQYLIRELHRHCALR